MVAEFVLVVIVIATILIVHWTTAPVITKSVSVTSVVVHSAVWIFASVASVVSVTSIAVRLVLVVISTASRTHVSASVTSSSSSAVSVHSVIVEVASKSSWSVVSSSPTAVLLVRVSLT